MKYYTMRYFLGAFFLLLFSPMLLGVEHVYKTGNGKFFYLSDKSEIIEATVSPYGRVSNQQVRDDTWKIEKIVKVLPFGDERIVIFATKRRSPGVKKVYIKDTLAAKENSIADMGERLRIFPQDIDFKDMAIVDSRLYLLTSNALWTKDLANMAEGWNQKQLPGTDVAKIQKIIGVGRYLVAYLDDESLISFDGNVVKKIGADWKRPFDMVPLDSEHFVVKSGKSVSIKFAPKMKNAIAQGDFSQGMKLSGDKFRLLEKDGLFVIDSTAVAAHDAMDSERFTNSEKVAGALSSALLQRLNIKTLIEVVAREDQDYRCIPVRGVTRHYVVDVTNSIKGEQCPGATILKSNGFKKIKVNEIAIEGRSALLALDVDYGQGVQVRASSFFKTVAKKVDLLLLESSMSAFPAAGHDQLLDLAALSQDRGKTKFIDTRFNFRDADTQTRDVEYRHYMAYGTADMIRDIEITECDADRSDRWKYLWSNNTLGVRQLIAVSLLKDRGIDKSIEIGGFCTPLCHYDPELKHYNIDYATRSKPAICRNSELLQADFTKVRLDYDEKRTTWKLDRAHIISNKWSLVIIGMWLRDLDKKPQEIDFLVNALDGPGVDLIYLETTPLNRWPELERFIESKNYRKIYDFGIDVLDPRPRNQNRNVLVYEKIK